ncbi:MAG: hypothetical protein ACT4OM_06515 [Actinomycetota bacterium]
MSGQVVIQEPDPGSRRCLELFSLLWGAAAVFHVLGPSGRAYGALPFPAPLAAAQILLCVAGVWLVVRPGRTAALLAVALLGFATAWLEAPLLGNHWLLAVFVNLGLILALLVNLRRRVDGQGVAGAFLPLARASLIIFYSFAAFAKLNSAFFNTATSCSTFFFDETASSLGLTLPATVGAGGLARLIPIGSALTELAIPALLLFRRFRSAGVVLALLFHSAIALDRTHLFIDFSAVLAALFMLFLPPGFARDALGYLRGRGKRLERIWLGLASMVLLAQWIGRSPLLGLIFLEGRMLLWYLTDLAVLVGVLVWLWRHRGEEALSRPFKLPAAGRAVWWILPALVAVNGLFAYFELRTAFAYTMYSNLRMVEGDSNHFLVRSSLPVGSRQADPVRVLATSDPAGLGFYVGTDFEIPWDSFKAYLARFPDLAVTFERGGELTEVVRAGDHPELIDAPPEALQKLMPMRAIDRAEPPRCQDVFLPAL